LGSYRIFDTDIFQNDLQQLPSAIRLKILDKLHSYTYPQLRNQPHFGPNIKKLRDWKPETWRYRIGPWRFFYEIDERSKIVSMTAMDHRKDAY